MTSTQEFTATLRHSNIPRIATFVALGLTAALCLFSAGPTAQAQLPSTKFGEVVPRDVREMYDRGLQYLAAKQTEKGDWPGGGYEDGPGPVGLGSWSSWPRVKIPISGSTATTSGGALRNLISSQDAGTGIMGTSMYHHGFAMLGLAEAYGAVDERNLWPDGKGTRSIGQALELAVRAAITSQKKNSLGGWRYSPDANDADTSVSGAVLVGLLAARNAGIEVPDEAIDRAISYYKSDDRPVRDRSPTPAAWAVSTSRSPGSRSPRSSTPWPAARTCREYKATLDYLKQTARAARPASSSANTPATTRPRRSFRATSTPGRNGTSCWSAS